MLRLLLEYGGKATEDTHTVEIINWPYDLVVIIPTAICLVCISCCLCLLCATESAPEPIYLQRVRDPTMMWLFDPERLTEDNNNGVSPAPAGQVTIVLNPDDQACLAKRDPKSSTKDSVQGKQLRDDDEE